MFFVIQGEKLSHIDRRTIEVAENYRKQNANNYRIRVYRVLVTIKVNITWA
jgi:hypothetical protein